jgi:hypothetical protein
MTNIPAIFASLMAVSKADPLIKYRRIHEGASPADVATIGQATAFLPILSTEIAQQHRICPVPSIVAFEGAPPFDANGKPSVGTGNFKAYKLSELVEDGFPDSTPCKLAFVFERGEKWDEEEMGANPNESISDHVDVRFFEAADLIRAWFADQSRVWAEIL